MLLARRRRALVVGAGLAGLAAAYELERAGWGVTVLEARNRIGGRVHTIRSFDGDQHAEAGGEYVDTSHRTLLGYARRFGLALEDVRIEGGDGDGVVYRGGRRRTYDGVATAPVRKQMNRFWARVDELADPLDPADPVEAALDRRSAADLLDQLGIHGDARFLVEHDLRDDYTVEAAELSLLFVCQQEKLGASLPESGVEAFRIRGGNDRVPAAFAKALSGEIVLGAAVNSIEHGGSGVRATAGARTYSAERCVLAAPLPALRTIAFSPPLPRTLRAAIAGVQYGAGTKTILQYRRRFWNPGFDGDVLTDLPISTAWEATAGQAGRSGILIGYTVGAPGRRWTALADGARVDAAAAELERIFPGSRAELGRAATVAWADEPYTGGTYTAYAPGQVTSFWRTLRRPVGTLVLAGEHTDAYTGYMEGALRSGRRAAAMLG